MKSKLLVGTSKGLVIFNCSDQHWSVDDVQFEGLPVSLTYIGIYATEWRRACVIVMHSCS